MSGQWQTHPAMSTPLKVALLVWLLAGLCWGIVLLERDRSRRLIADDVKLWRTDAGTLRGVTFVGSDVTDDHWSLIGEGADSLYSLNLSNTQEVAGGLAVLADFPELRDLYLDGCRWVDDAEISRIAGRHRLRSLDISGTRITDEGLRQLDLSELVQLRADGCTGLTDETVEMLRELPLLKHVSLSDVPISFDQFERLRIERPDMVMMASPPLSWEVVDRPELYIGEPVYWLTSQTDVDQFIRYRKLPHDWESGSFGEDARRRHLALGGPGVSGALPRILLELTELESLRLVDTKLDDGLPQLPRNVTSLSLMRLHAGSRLDSIESVDWLKSVFLRDLELTADQLSKVFSMITASQSLTTLTVSRSEVPSGAFLKLREHRELQHLWLINSHVTDADLKAIGQIASLEVLDVDRIPVSDAVVESWLDLPNLTYLDTRGSGVSPAMAQRLRQRYPEAYIHIR